jgi:hypothetical protein
VSTRRAFLSALVVFASASCREERAVTDAAGALPEVEARGAVKSAVRTETVAGQKVEPAAIEPAAIEQPSIAEGEDPKALTALEAQARKIDCKHGPPWVRTARCQADDQVYAAGRIRGIYDLSLARTTAAQRAREALLGRKGKAKLQGSEVVDVFACKGEVFALARAPKSAVTDSVPACDRAAISARSPAAHGCPEWTQRVSWREGSTISAVGAARLKNHALAEAAAANRARAELTKVVSVETLDHGAASAGAGSFSEVSKERAFCDGYTYVMVVAKQLDAATH